MLPPGAVAAQEKVRIYIYSLVSAGFFTCLSPLIFESTKHERVIFKVTFPYGSKALLNAKFELMN